jgi:hypothetical protein
MKTALLFLQTISFLSAPFVALAGTLAFLCEDAPVSALVWVLGVLTLMLMQGRAMERTAAAI